MRNEIFTFHSDRHAPHELHTIMEKWFELSRQTGDHGSCVLGAGFRFVWNGLRYFMLACSPWQGSISWEEHIDEIRGDLERIGCTDISYDWGRMD